MDKDYYYALILDQIKDDCDLKNSNNPKVEEALDYFEMKQINNMGIGLMCGAYIFAKENQDIWEEYAKILKMLNCYVENHAKQNGKTAEDYSLEFINYGRTQLVYVLTDKINGEKITLLAKQPVVEFGKVKQEAKNLIELNKKDKTVVAPVDYFAFEEQEMYVTPYFNQARCIASDACGWGMYVPEPFYRFEKFTREQERVVNVCMIAKLISLYNPIKQEGISACKLGGGDFMLPKNWENMPPRVDLTYRNLYLIAAREKVKCSLNEYIELIRKEFSRVTIKENQSSLVVNHRGRFEMKGEDIETGINLGLKMLRCKGWFKEKSE